MCYALLCFHMLVCEYRVYMCHVRTNTTMESNCQSAYMFHFTKLRILFDFQMVCIVECVAAAGGIVVVVGLLRIFTYLCMVLARDNHTRILILTHPLYIHSLMHTVIPIHATNNKLTHIRNFIAASLFRAQFRSRSLSPLREHTHTHGTTIHGWCLHLMLNSNVHSASEFMFITDNIDTNAMDSCKCLLVGW